MYLKMGIALGMALMMAAPGIGPNQSTVPDQGTASKQENTYWGTEEEWFSKWGEFENVIIVPAKSTAEEMLEEVNGYRRSAGLKELTLSEDLTKVAQTKAEDMRDRQYFDHTSPTYGSPFDMMKKFGIGFRTAGENIAMGQESVEEVMVDWMLSPGHRANILNGKYTQLGVGYCTDASGNTYWVQMFIG